MVPIFGAKMKMLFAPGVNWELKRDTVKTTAFWGGWTRALGKHREADHPHKIVNRLFNPVAIWNQDAVSVKKVLGVLPCLSALMALSRERSPACYLIREPGTTLTWGCDRYRKGAA